MNTRCKYDMSSLFATLSDSPRGFKSPITSYKNEETSKFSIITLASYNTKDSFKVWYEYNSTT